MQPEVKRTKSNKSTPIRGDEGISPQSLHYDRPNSKVVLELLRNEVGGNVERNITRDATLAFFKLDPKRSAQGTAPFVLFKEETGVPSSRQT
jgi:hypothetical protein